MGKKRIEIAKYIILLNGVIFVLIGIMRDEHKIVLKKAINVCLECVGIG